LPYSPEIKPKENIPIPTDKRHRMRSLIIESSTLSVQAQAQGLKCTQVSATQDPQGRNANHAAHNIIEKRYRTSINAKFLALEKAICPASVRKSSPGRAGTDVGSLKKPEILSIALTYIKHIQQEKLTMHKELALLKQGLVSGGI
jgi:hypothetical protein